MIVENYGSSVLITPSTTAQEAVVLAAEPGRGKRIPEGALPRGYEVTLEREQDASGDDSLFVDCYAVLQWGTGGVRHQAVMDWRVGARVFLPAESVRVSAGCVVYAEAGAPHTAIRFVASARACDGGSKGGARRTLYAGQLAAGAFSSWAALPKFAKTVTTAGAGERAIYAAPTGATTGADMVSQNAGLKQPLELASHQRFWSIENLSGEQNYYWALFDLDL